MKIIAIMLIMVLITVTTINMNTIKEYKQIIKINKAEISFYKEANLFYEIAIDTYQRLVRNTYLNAGTAGIECMKNYDEETCLNRLDEVIQELDEVIK